MRLPGGLVDDGAAVEVQVEGVAVREPALVEETAIRLVDRQVEPPVVAVILVRRVLFVCAVDDPQVEVVSIARNDARPFPKAERERLVEPGCAAVCRVQWTR